MRLLLLCGRVGAARGCRMVGWGQTVVLGNYVALLLHWKVCVLNTSVD